ncbi:hypothetical protein BURK2_02808 [Burkholderiales bacterium]|nr:hypothetical protein BURK2_02808 [Burkholderiales bacterium]
MMEAFDLRQALQVATLDALLASRRWEPGHLVFQGGTSLHLVHSSPRFSEDLDFLVDSALKLDSISASMRARLEGTIWIPPDTALTIGKAKDGRNPHAFVVSIGGPEVVGAVRVKVELWQTTATVLSATKVVVAPVRLARGAMAGMQTFVPTAELQEIYADKVFALAARPYLKPRDVFDLHWLCTHSGLRGCTEEALRARLATYPSETPGAWLRKALARREELMGAGATIAADLKRWLPSSWPLGEGSAKDMARTAVEAMDQGIILMREIDSSLREDYERPTP